MMKDISDYYDQGERALQEHMEWIVNDSHDAMIEQVVKHCREVDAKRVMEFGCGSGILARGVKEALPSVDYMAIDKCQAMLRIAVDETRRAGMEGSVRFAHGDVRKWPAGAEQADIVVGFRIMKHFGLHEWEEVLVALSSHAPHACFDMQMGEEEIDDGKDFHHTTIGEGRLVRALTMAGHRELSRWKEFPVPGLGNFVFWTERVGHEKKSE